MDKHATYEGIFGTVLVGLFIFITIYITMYIPNGPGPIGSNPYTDEGRIHFFQSLSLIHQRVVLLSDVESPKFSVPSTIVLIDDYPLEVYEFADSLHASIQAAKYNRSSDESLFRYGKVLAYYNGSDSNIITALKELSRADITDVGYYATNECDARKTCEQGTCVVFNGDSICTQSDPCSFCENGCRLGESYPPQVFCQ